MAAALHILWTQTDRKTQTTLKRASRLVHRVWLEARMRGTARVQKGMVAVRGTQWVGERELLDHSPRLHLEHQSGPSRAASSSVRPILSAPARKHSPQNTAGWRVSRQPGGRISGAPHAFLQLRQVPGGSCGGGALTLSSSMACWAAVQGGNCSEGSRKRRSCSCCAAVAADARRTPARPGFSGALSSGARAPIAVWAGQKNSRVHSPFPGFRGVNQRHHPGLGVPFWQRSLRKCGLRWTKPSRLE